MTTAATDGTINLSRLLREAKADHQARHYRYTGSEEVLERWAQSFVPKDASVFIYGTRFLIHFDETVQRPGTDEEVEMLTQLFTHLSMAGQFEIAFSKESIGKESLSAPIRLSPPPGTTVKFILRDLEKVNLIVSREWKTLEVKEGTLAEMWDYALRYAI